MADQTMTDEWMTHRLGEWVEKNNSLITQSKSGKYYGLFWEPDGEGPRMQYMGASLQQAYNFIRLKPSNIYTIR